jgi:fibronectin type 3 domain-containing protein
VALAYGGPLTPNALETAVFEDTTAQPGLAYCYVVRTAIASDPLIESDASNEVCLDVQDVKAPDAPLGLAALAADDGVEISWSPSPESDLVAYRLYRSGRGGAGEKLGEILAPATSFKDQTARPGARYRYSLTAVDKAGNESKRSVPVDGGR